jgi:hypothetical protein
MDGGDEIGQARIPGIGIRHFFFVLEEALFLKLNWGCDSVSWKKNRFFNTIMKKMRSFLFEDKKLIIVMLNLEEQHGLECTWSEKPITENLLARQPDLGCHMLRSNIPCTSWKEKAVACTNAHLRTSSSVRPFVTKKNCNWWAVCWHMPGLINYAWIMLRLVGDSWDDPWMYGILTLVEDS